MSQALLQHVQKSSKSLKPSVPNIQPGNRVKVHQRIMESTKDGAKERIQIFEGLVIALNSGSGTDKTFTVRKISGGIGVEKIFPLHSRNIAKIEVMGQSKIRRSKLYFMRERTGKRARLREGKLVESEIVTEYEEEKPAEEVNEATEPESTETTEVAPEENKAQEEPKPEEAKSEESAQPEATEEEK